MNALLFVCIFLFHVPFRSLLVHNKEKHVGFSNQFSCNKVRANQPVPARSYRVQDSAETAASGEMWERKDRKRQFEFETWKAAAAPWGASDQIRPTGVPYTRGEQLTWLRGQFDKSRSRGGPHLKEQVSIQVRLSTDICITVMEEISDLIIFPERFRGPLKTLWRPHLTRGPLIAHPCPTPFWRIHVRSRATYEAYVEGSVLVDQCASLIYQHASSHMSFVRFSKKPAAWINAILEQPWSSCVLFVDCPTLA